MAKRPASDECFEYSKVSNHSFNAAKSNFSQLRIYSGILDHAFGGFSACFLLCVVFCADTFCVHFSSCDTICEDLVSLLIIIVNKCQEIKLLTIIELDTCVIYYFTVVAGKLMKLMIMKLYSASLPPPIPGPRRVGIKESDWWWEEFSRLRIDAWNLKNFV